jgi:hypothetical protein
VECKLAREIEVLRKPASVPLVHHKSHMTWQGSNPGCRGPSAVTNYSCPPAYGHWQTSYAYILWVDQLCYFRSLNTSVWTDNMHMLIRGQAVFEGIITWSILIILYLTKYSCLSVGGKGTVFNIYCFILYIFFISCIKVGAHKLCE